MGGYDDDPRDDDEERYRDVDDDEDDIDDEDEDDDISSRLGNRPRPNPFASSGASGSGQRSGLPGSSSGSSSYSSRFGESGSSSPGGGGLSSRLGASGGGTPSAGSNLPGAPRFGSGSGSNPSGGGGLSSRLPGSPGSNRDAGDQPSTSRFGSGSGGSPSGGSSGGSGGFNRPSSPSSPSRDTSEQPSTSRFGSGSGGSPSGGSSGGSGGFNRPSSPSSPSRDTSEQPSTSRFGSGSGGSPSGGSSGGSGGFNRPSSPSSPSRDTGEQPSTSRFGSGSGGSPSGGSSGGSGGFNRPSSPSSPIRGGEPNAPGSSSGSSINRSDLGSRLGAGGSPASGSGSFGSMRSPGPSESEKQLGDKKDAAPSRPFGAKTDDKKSDDKKSDDKKDAGASGGLGSRLGGLTGGITSRFGGGGDEKKDDAKKPDARKPDDKKDAGAAGGLGSRLGGLTGGITSRFGGGGDEKKDDAKKPDARKPDDKKDAGAAGGLGARLGGLTSGLTSRFGGGKEEKKDEKKDAPARPAGGASAPMGGSSGGASRFGGGAGSPASTSTPVRPSSPSSPLSSASAGAKQSPLGGAKAGAAQPAKADAGKGGAPAASLGARFSAFTQSLPLIGKRDGKAAAKKQRASKVPEVKKSEGMSLDTKLDILGVVLVFSSMIIFFSALSPSQGEVTGQINRVVGEWLGWGALAFPVTLLASGVWLILRHFGDKAPEIDPLRIIGVTMLYLGLLVIFQFVESLNYTGDRAVYSLIDLENQVHVSYGAYRAGGGLIGGELYLFLVSNITEVGAFFTVLGWMFVGFMLFADLSASEVAIVIISIWRSFSDSVKRQRQRRASRIAELQAQRAAAAATAALAAPQQPQIAVSRPAPSELPAVATSGALPAPAVPTPVAIPAPPVPQTEERSIPMRLGGRSEILKVDGSGRPAAPAAGLSTAPQPETLPAAAEKKDEAEASGLGSRLRGALPFGGKSAAEPTAEKPAAPAADKPAAASSLAGRLFGNKSAEPAADKPLPAAATPTPAANKPAAASSLAGRLFGNKGAADKPESPAATPTSAPAPSRTVPISPTAAAGQPPSSPAPSAATPSTAPAAQASTEMPAARLGDLLRSGPAPTFDKPAALSTPSTSPAATPPPSPFSRPAAPPSSTVPLSRPVVDDEEDMDEDDESVLDMSPARPKGMGPVPRPPSAFGTGGLPGTKPTESEAPKPAGGIAERMDRLNALRSGATAPVPPMPRPGVDDDEEDKPAAPAAKVEPAVTPKPTDEAAKPAAEASAAAQQGGLGTRIRPFNFGEQGDKPAATVSASVVSGAPATPPKEGEEKKPPVFTPAGTPAVTAAPKISLPIGHPDTPPAPTTAAPAPTFAGAQQIKRPKREWKLPDYRTLLATGSDQDFDRAFLTQRARVIEDTLQSFGAPGKVVEINTGPVITQFGVEPDYLMSRSGKKNRIKVSAIAALDKDLQLALGAKSIRIEAPVPGKGFVGVEVPNDEAALVSLRDVMDSDEFKKIDSPLTIALGQSVDGTPVAADLSSMPHLLIAGTTGSGKSVCVNAIISSLVLLNSPERVKFIMVDPKRVELTGYNGIPHLVAPVVVELERIVGVLKWVTREMDERYKKFSAAGARNIEDYNKHLPADAEIMPYIVVIIDELADLMMLAPDETERVITRIAALARATGIHLVIATQRPSVDVVTGLIKANFPARIAFAVAGSVDSRVILDQPGAERLLGRGDMLYMSGDSPAPVRLQGVYVSDVEINNIVRYWKQQSDESGGMPVPQLILDKSIASDSSSGLRMGGTTQQPPKPVVQQQAFWDRSGGNSARDEDEDGYDDEVEDADGDGEDDMYDEAVELIRKLNKASVSLLQRRLRIGYTRAARLIDLMEERGVVGPAESGSKPRDVLPAKD